MSRLLENGLKSVNSRSYQGGQGWLWWALTAVVNSQLAIACAAHLARTARLEDARALMTRVAYDAEAISGWKHPAARHTQAFLNALLETSGEDDMHSPSAAEKHADPLRKP